MPWRQVEAMKERLQFVRDARRAVPAHYRFPLQLDGSTLGSALGLCVATLGASAARFLITRNGHETHRQCSVRHQDLG